MPKRTSMRLDDEVWEGVRIQSIKKRTTAGRLANVVLRAYLDPGSGVQEMVDRWQKEHEEK